MSSSLAIGWRNCWKSADFDTVTEKIIRWMIFGTQCSSKMLSFPLLHFCSEVLRTTKCSIKGVRTTSTTIFFLLLWTLTLTFKLDLNSVHRWTNQQAKYLGQSSLSLKVIVRTHRHTLRTYCFTWTTKVVSKIEILQPWLQKVTKRSLSERFILELHPVGNE